VLTPCVSCVCPQVCPSDKSNVRDNCGSKHRNRLAFFFFFFVYRTLACLTPFISALCFQVCPSNQSNLRNNRRSKHRHGRVFFCFFIVFAFLFFSLRLFTIYLPNARSFAPQRNPTSATIAALSTDTDARARRISPLLLHRYHLHVLTPSVSMLRSQVRTSNKFNICHNRRFKHPPLCIFLIVQLHG